MKSSKFLLTSLLAAAAMSATTFAETDLSGFSGTIYTWAGRTTSGNDLAYGYYYTTDTSGNFTAVTSGASTSWTNVQSIIATDRAAATYQNTLRFIAFDDSSFTGDYTAGDKKTPIYTFNPLTLGGIIVESGATGFSISASGTGGTRSFMLGNGDGTAAKSVFHESFTLTLNTGASDTTNTIRGTQTWTIDENKTFTITSGSNALNFTGATTINGGGTATLSGSNVSFGAGASIDIAANTTLNLSGANVTLASAIANSGAVTISDATVFNLTQTGTTTLISAGGTIAGVDWNSLTLSNFTYNGETLTGRSTVNVSTAGAVTLDYVAAANLVWNGGSAGTWNTETTNTIWTNDRSPSAFYTRDNVTFSGDAAVTVADGGVTAGAVTISAGNVVLSGGDVTVMGTATIASGASLSYNNAGTQSLVVSSTDGTFIKTGTGTLTLSNASAANESSTNNKPNEGTIDGIKYLTVDAGKVILGNMALHNVSGLTVTVNSGATLDLNGKTLNYKFAQYVLNGGALVNNGTSYGNGNTQATSIMLGADSEIGGSKDHGLLGGSFDSTTLALNGHTLTKTGAGAFWLTTTTITTTDSSASSAGTIRIEGGSVKINDQHSSKKSDASKADFVLAGGTLNLNGYNLSVRSISGTSGTLALGAKTLTVGANSDGSDYALGAAITGSGKIIKSDRGVLTLSGNSNAGNSDDGKFTGTLEINAGMVKFGAASGVLGKTDTSGGELAENTRYAAVVKTGGTLDINGQTEGGNNCYKIELAGGSLVNNGSNVGTNQRQITGLKLSADSMVGGTGNFGLIAGNYAENTLQLNGNTLTKTGLGKFWLISTAVTAGNINVEGGTLWLANGKNNNADKLFSMDSDTWIKLDGGTIEAGRENGASQSVALGNVAIVLKDTTTQHILANKESGTNARFTVAEGAVLYLDIDTLGADVLTGEQVALTIAAGNAIDSFFADVQVGTYVDDAWLISSEWKYLADSWNVGAGTLKISAIPEPSVFGLLAGLGALALAGARRRRKKA